MSEIDTYFNKKYNITPTITTSNTSGGSIDNYFANKYSSRPIAEFTQPKKTGLIPNIIGGLKTVVSDVKDVWTQPKPESVKISPENYLKGVSSWGENVIKGWSDFGNSLIHPEVKKDTSLGLNAAIAVGESGIKFVQAFFTPVSDLFTKAAGLPGPVGDVADKVNKIFGTVGILGSDVAEGSVQAIPIVSQETKDAITPLFKEIGALTGQIILGKATDVITKKVVTNTKTIIKKIAEDSRLKELNQNPAIKESISRQLEKPTKVSVKSENIGETKIPVNTPASRYKKYIEEQGYEAYIEPSKLPTIQMGAKSIKGKSNLPVIEFNAKGKNISSLPEGLKLEPIKEKITINNIDDYFVNKYKIEPPTQQSTIPPTTPKTVTSPELPIDELMGKSKIGMSIEAKAVEAKLTKGFEETAGYTKLNIKADAQASTDLINKDLITTRKIISGELPLPREISNPLSLVTAMELHIKNLKDATLRAELSYELANSHLISESSKAAQTMRVAQERTQDSASEVVDIIRKEREAKAFKGKETVASVKKELKTETEKVNLSKTELSWENFLDNIAC